MASDFVARIRHTITAHGLIPPTSRVLAAVSGGQDSVALLFVLHELTSELGFQLVAAHVDHGTRPADAAQEKEFVARLCRQLNVPLQIRRCDAPAYAAAHRCSLEEAAREVRYAALSEMADALGADRIAVGHTMDDRAETVLLNVIRGAGLAGLTAMRPHQGRLIRPLLDVTRDMTGAYCREIGVQPRFDPTNRQLAFQRNRLRAELLPYLAAYFNPSAREAIVRMSQLLQEDADYLDSLADNELRSVLDSQSPYHCSLKGDRLMLLPRAIASRVLRKAIASLRGHSQDVSRELVQAVLRHVALGCGKRASWTLPRDGTVIRVGTNVEIMRPQPPRHAEAVTVPIDGSVALPNGLRISTSLVTATTSPTSLHDDVLQVPVSAIEPPLRASAPMPGDRLRPLGLSATKKLSDILVDRKVPRPIRPLLIVIRDAAGILWVPGVAADERVRITALPASCLEIRLNREL